MRAFYIGAASVAAFAGVKAINFVLESQRKSTINLRDKPFFNEIAELTEKAQKYMELPVISYKDTDKIDNVFQKWKASSNYCNFTEYGWREHETMSPELVKYRELENLYQIIIRDVNQHKKLYSCKFNSKPISTPKMLIDFVKTYDDLTFALNGDDGDYLKESANAIVAKTEEYASAKEQLDKHFMTYYNVGNSFKRCLKTAPIIRKYDECGDYNEFDDYDDWDAMRLKCAEDTLRAWKPT